MILRLEQALTGIWIHIIDLPVDDFHYKEISELVNTLTDQFLHNTKILLSNPEANYSIVVNADLGPIRIQYLEADEDTHLYRTSDYGARGNQD